MNKDDKPKNAVTEPSKPSSRRGFLRSAAGVSAGLLIARAGWAAATRKKDVPEEKVSVLPSCVGCTGCVSLCPTDAIVVVENGIGVTDNKCVSCGYCAAICPVAGIRINRVWDGGHEQ